MGLRVLLYGLVGWCTEIVWTAGYDAVTGTREIGGGAIGRARTQGSERLRLAGRTYLWMLPVYGLGGFLFEPVHDALRSFAWPLRGLVWAAGAFAIEYLAGGLLRLLTGRCPWDYSYARTSVNGLIRLDYAPVWFVFGMLLERVHDVAVAVEPSLRAALVGSS